MTLYYQDSLVVIYHGDNDLIAAYDDLKEVIGPSTEESVGATMRRVYEARAALAASDEAARP